jgi:hypothetical protein
MAKCANCDAEAVHFIRNNLHNDLDYCEAHLPKALRKRVNAGESFPEPKPKRAQKADAEE